MADNQFKVIIGGDLSGMEAAFNAGIAAVKQFGNTINANVATALKSFNQLNTAARELPKAFEKIPTSISALNVAGINTLRDAVAKLRSDLKADFKPVFSVVAPPPIKVTADASQYTAVLNSAEAQGNDFATYINKKLAETEIKADASDFNAALDSAAKVAISTSDTIARKVISINQSLAGLQVEAQRLPAAFANIPAALAPISNFKVTSINVLRDAVSQLKTDLSTGFKPVISDVLSAQSNSVNQFGAAINRNLPAAITQFSRLSTAIAGIPPFPPKNLTVLNTDSIVQYNNAVTNLKKNLATGFAPVFSQLTPPEVKVTADASQFTRVLTGAENEARQFAGDVNTSLNTVITTFRNLANEAAGLPAALDKIPASLKGFNVEGLNAMRKNVADLKADLATGFKPVFSEIKIPEVRLTADASDLLNDVQRAEDELEDLSAATRDFNQDAKKNLSNIIIGADGKPLLRTLSQLEAEAKDFTATLKTTSDPRILAQLNKNLADTHKNIKIIKGVGVNVFAGLKPGAQQAGLALTDFSRIIQDIPFGFIGIQNNLNPVLDSFVRLKTETGSTKSALKAMVGSLTGIGGLGLALAAVSTAFTIYQNGISGFNRKSQEARDRTREFIDTLKSVDDITFDATGNVQGQIAQVNALAKAIQDTRKPYEERRRALEELQKVNKSYFGDLTLEAGKLGTVTAAVQEYTQALVQQALVKGLTDEISRLSVELLKQENALEKAAAAYAPLVKAKDNLVASATPNARNFTGDLTSVQNLRNLGKVEQAFIDQVNTVSTLRVQLANLTKGLETANAKALQFKGLDSVDKGSEAKQKKDADLLRERIDLLEKLRDEIGLLKSESDELVDLKIKLTLRDAGAEGLTEGQITRRIQQIIKTGGLEADIKVPVNIIPFVSGTTNLIDTIIPADFAQNMYNRMRQAAEAAKKGLEDSDIIQALEELNQKMRETIQEGSVDLFAGIADAIGSAFGSGDNPLAAFAKSFLTIVGSVLQTLGKQIIAASKLVIALKRTLEGVGLGAASLALGLALVAAGGFMKSVKIQKFQDGGLVTGPTYGLVGEAGPELIIPLNKLGGLMSNNEPTRVVGQLALRGRDLIYALKEEEKSQYRGF